MTGGEEVECRPKKCGPHAKGGGGVCEDRALALTQFYRKRVKPGISAANDTL